jgi:hypothetical protein
VDGFRLESLLEVDKDYPPRVKPQADSTVEGGLGELAKVG